MTEDLENKVSDLQKFIYGNGDVGIAERLRRVEDALLVGKRAAYAVIVGVSVFVGSKAWEMVTWYLENKT